MNIDKMTKKDFEQVRRRDWQEEIGEFDSLVIIPGKANDLHDSGYRNITYCLCRDNEPICLTGGGSDVVHLDGIGGYGIDWLKRYGTVPHLIPPSGWNMDCLPKTGYLRLWGNSSLTCGIDLSSFEVYTTGQKKQ